MEKNQPRIICVVGSRDLNYNELQEVEALVTELVKQGHYILTDGSRTVGLKVMQTVYKLDPTKIYVYLHSLISKNPINTRSVLREISKNQIVEIPGPYSQRNIFYRNKIMVQKADLVIAFWKNQSPGTKHIIQCCKKNKPPIPVIINEYWLSYDKVYNNYTVFLSVIYIRRL